MQPQADAQIEVESGTIDAEKFDAEMENLGDDWQSDKSTVTSSDVDDKYQYMMDTLSEGPTLHEQLTSNSLWLILILMKNLLLSC